MSDLTVEVAMASEAITFAISAQISALTELYAFILVCFITSVSYTGNDNSFYYTAALGGKYYLADNTNLYVDTKYGQSSDDIQNLTVDFGFISRF